MLRLRRAPGVRTYLLVAMVALAVTSVVTTSELIRHGVDVQLDHFAARELNVPAGGPDTGAPAPAAQAAATRLDRRLEGPLNHAGLLAAALAALLGLVLALLVSLWMARPVQRLTEVARRMEAGHLAPGGVPAGGGREIAELARTLDRLATALAEHEQLRQATAADVTHELRGALVGVVARIEVLQEGMAADEQEVLVRMAADAARLHRLIDDVRRLVDAQRPDLLVDKRPVDLGEIAGVAAERHAAVCQARAIALQVDIVEQFVDGDRERLLQVLDNLIANAVRYTDDSGLIAVSVRRSGRAVVASVADTGIGLTTEQRGRVFDRFWRAGEAVVRAPEGSGVGLAVVAEIVRAHGGRVDVVSRPRLGSTFSVVLPPGARAGAPGARRAAVSRSAALVRA